MSILIHYIFVIGFVLISTQEVSASFDYSSYAKLLKTYVVQKGGETRVRYQQLKKNKNELLAVNQSFSQVSKSAFDSWSADEQKAFLINVYNSFTLQLIVDHYPVESIKDIGGFFSSPWKKEFFSMFGKSSHLDQVEHEWLRKSYKEPRIHFAVNCASIGCPPLQIEVFVGARLDQQLESATRAFVSSPIFNRYDPKANVLHLSSIFKWYGDDFGDEKALRSFVAERMDVEGLGREASVRLQEAKLDYLEYDWRLNVAK